MATFPSISPTYTGFSKRSRPRVRTIRFQDGFEHRLVFGLAEHQNPKVYNLSFNVTETQSDEIETFLDARGGTESFDFTAPGETSSQKFVCERWSKSIPYNNRAIIDATFREVFEA
tara:strand:+ start:157 stop:504 length:348 start_codon:yes stop_codon:yes gene_type:complete